MCKNEKNKKAEFQSFHQRTPLIILTRGSNRFSSYKQHTLQWLDGVRMVYAFFLPEEYKHMCI